MERFTGPVSVFIPRPRANAAAASSSAFATSGSFGTSNIPKKPVSLLWNWFQSASSIAAMRPTTLPLRRARKSSTSAWLKKGFFFRFRKSRRSATMGGTKYGSSR